MNEEQTKHDYITPALQKSGWGSSGSRIRLEFPITQGRIIGKGKRAKPLKADYVLIYKNRIIGVVEAKALDKYYTEGLAQAKDYAERLKVRFTYCTNGKRIYGVDMHQGTEGDVERFPTPDELWEMTFPTPKESYKIEIEQWKERLFSVPFEDRGGTWQPRYYQQNAISKVLESIAEKKNRILLTLATGTGKTAIAFQIAWKLFNAKWNLQREPVRSPRILFLADRNILADQAFNSFGAFEEDALVRIRPSEIKKNGRVPRNGNIFFTIFQTFMTSAQKGNIEEDENNTEELTSSSFNFGQYPKDFFDLIIIDECHRGGANDESSWRAIMEYFAPAVQLGLTATPKRDVNADTYEYFGEPVYTYKLKDGINDGFLTPFMVKEIQTNYDEYTITRDDTIIEGEAEIGDTFTYVDYGRKIIIDEVERYRVKTFMQMINQNQKTLVFCATQTHAAIIRDLINQISESKNENYCVRVTANDGNIGEKFLRAFQDNEKIIPTILTTSQKLSTGVDAPEIRNIVLLRPVNSMVEFKQIVGRGTRLFDDKTYFTIYDFVKAHNHFQDAEWDGDPEPPQAPNLTTGSKKDGCKKCGQKPCVCENNELQICNICNSEPCICEVDENKMVILKLSDSKVIEIDSTVKTSFWSPSGRPISAQEFIQELFKDLPTLFKDEKDLREKWSLPSKRKKIIEALAEKGYTQKQLDDLCNLIRAENSDLFDVLNYIAYQKTMIPRIDRANKAKKYLKEYNVKQQDFLNFVLEQYVKQGFTQLDDHNLADLLELKYSAIADAKRELGDIKSIRQNFIGFQQRIYQYGVA